jgi:ribosomal-protein-alanine N-acetyltransferase
MDIKIRPVFENEISDICALEKECFGADPWDENMFRMMLESPAGNILVAKDGDKLCGFVCVYIVAGDRDRVDGDADLSDIAVAPEYRNKGIARALMGEVYRLARKKYCEKIFLEVRRSNTPAQSLYLSEGFTVYRERKNYYSEPREDAVLMSREL